MKHTKENLEKSLDRAVRQDTPNVLPSILSQIKKQEKKMNTPITNIPVNIQGNTPRKKPKYLRWIAAAAVFVVLAVSAVMMGTFLKTDAIIYFDVNPGIELDINSFGKVTSAKALNSEAEAMLDEMNLKNVDLNVAVNALIGSMVRNGYITENKNAVLISIVSKGQKSEQLREDLMQEVEGVLSSSAFDGAILGQTVTSNDNLKQIATSYNISIGKAALVDMLVKQDNLLNLDDVANLSINEIYLLLNAKNADTGKLCHSGQASTGEYISESSAKEMAFSHAGVSNSDVVFYEIEFDYDHGRMIYELEFNTQTAEYDYEIDARTGEVIYSERDGSEYTQNPATNPSNNTYIGEEAAKAKALAHAGVTASNITFTHCTLEEDDGVMIYDVEFCTNTHSYEYEINAVTGEIIDADVDSHEDDHNHSHDGSNRNHNNSNSGYNNSNNNSCDGLHEGHDSSCNGQDGSNNGHNGSNNGHNGSNNGHNGSNNGHNGSNNGHNGSNGHGN